MSMENTIKSTIFEHFSVTKEIKHFCVSVDEWTKM